MKRKMDRIVAGLGLLLAGTAWAGEGQVRKLELVPGPQRTVLVIQHSGEGRFRLFKSEMQSSVIVEAENLALPPALTKLIDASSSSGPVMQLTPYNSQHSGHAMAKLVLQLRGRADVTSTDSPGRFTVEIVRKPGSVPAAPSAARVVRDEVKGRLSAAAKAEETARRLIEVLSAPQDEKKYFGSKVTFEAKDAEVPDIFRLVGESSELNIIWDPDVEGQKTSLAVKDLPWDQLLDIVVQQKGYKATVMGNVVRIMTVDTFNKQAEAKKKEISLSDELEPIIMSVIPLGFTQAADMKHLIGELIQEKTSAGAAAAQAALSNPGGSSEKLSQDFKRGRIETDERTNSLIITNTKDSIERIRRLVKELDVPVPQVLIDSKIIIASEQFSRSLGVSWSGGAFSSSGQAGMNAGTMAANIPQFAPPSTPGASASTLAPAPFIVSAPPTGLGMGVGFGTTSAANVHAMLQVSEIDNLTKTVASPRVIVNNNKPANITDGQEITIPPAAGAGTQGQPTTVKAALSLKVTPQVTSVGSVQLKDLTVTKDQLGAVVNGNTSKDTKTVTTDVLVDSGATLVLGGVYQLSNSQDEQGIPILKDLPFIGQLFRTNSKSHGKEELMVFITPQIIDPQAASQSL